jgi:hypothetical protein
MNRAPRCVKRLFHGVLMRGVGKGIGERGKAGRGEARGARERNGVTVRVEG